MLLALHCHMYQMRLCLVLFHKLSNRLWETGAMRAYRHMEMPLTPLLARMEVFGVRFKQPDGDGLMEMAGSDSYMLQICRSSCIR